MTSMAHSSAQHKTFHCWVIVTLFCLSEFVTRTSTMSVRFSWNLTEMINMVNICISSWYFIWAMAQHVLQIACTLCEESDHPAQPCSLVSLHMALFWVVNDPNCLSAVSEVYNLPTRMRSLISGRTCNLSGPEVIKHFSCSTQLSFHLSW